MSRALLAVAEGIDDLQCVTLIDVLRRADIDLVVASVEGRRMFTCLRGTRLTADTMLMDVLAQPFDLIVLPGGEAGAARLGDHPPLAQRMKEQARAGGFFAAIGEAPVLALQPYGLLRQRQMTCHPDVSDKLSGCRFIDQPVVVDGNCITAQGSAAALAFALTLVEQLCGRRRRQALIQALVLQD